MNPDVLRLLQIDQSSSVPPFEQLRLRILGAAHDGSLPVGTRLPPVRTLAGELGMAVNTVARAYRELEQAGVVVTRSRAGTVVAAAGDEARRRAAEGATEFAALIKANGLTEDEAVSYLRAALRRG